MATVDDNHFTKILQDLVKLDYDAIAAYEEAIERLSDEDARAHLRSYCEDHRRHTQNLAPFISERGADVPQAAGAMKILTEGKVKLAGVVGSDKAVLSAMLANEEVTNKSYEKAVEHGETSPEILAVLRENLADERRHREWIKSAIDQH